MRLSTRLEPPLDGGANDTTRTVGQAGCQIANSCWEVRYEDSILAHKSVTWRNTISNNLYLSAILLGTWNSGVYLNIPVIQTLPTL